MSCISDFWGRQPSLPLKQPRPRASRVASKFVRDMPRREGQGSRLHAVAVHALTIGGNAVINVMYCQTAKLKTIPYIVHWIAYLGDWQTA